MSEIEVYDEIFSNEDCINIVKEFRKYNCESKNIHGHFNIGDTILNNPIEYMIRDLMNKMGDRSNMAEYWYRECWMDMRCHQDINEYLFRSNKEIHIPKYGNILYISDGTYEGATFIFDKDNKNTTLIYPKRGRYTRFRGDMFHYVPCPFSYILGDDNKFKGCNRRIVLLFNTWDIFIPDPKMPSPINHTNFRIFSKEKKEWIKREILQQVPLNKSKFSIRVKFMGNEKRRLGTDVIQRFYVNRRFKRDGFHRQIMKYEIEKIELIDEFTY